MRPRRDLALARAVRRRAANSTRPASACASVLNGSDGASCGHRALRLARVLIAQGKPDEALATLDAADGRRVRARCSHDVRGDVLLAKGDKPARAASTSRPSKPATRTAASIAAHRRAQARRARRAPAPPRPRRGAPQRTP